MRLYLVFGVIFLLGGVILFKLFEKQVIEFSQYARAARNQSESETKIQAQRGRILTRDINGELFPLAVSEWTYELLVTPRQIKNKRSFAEILSPYLPEMSVEEIYSKVNNDEVYIPPLVKNLSSERADEIRAQNLIGVTLQPKLVRTYPERENLAAQIVGFVDAAGIGKYGIEAVYDRELRGLPGERVAKRDSLGRLIDILTTKEPQSGSDIILTVDHNVQFVAETELKKAIETYQADGGSVVIINPKTGAVIAMAGYPTYDPNNFSKLAPEEHFKFLSTAASNVYEPGSVVKPLTMAVALDVGAVTPETTETFGGSVQVLDRTIKNAEDKTFGRQNMTQVLENSDNVAMVWVSQQIGAEKLYQFFANFGFGKKLGLDVVGEQAGLLRPLKEWNDVLRSTAGFGQGISTTTVQLAAAYSALANGGNLVTPYLAEKAVVADKATAFKHPDPVRVIKQETADAVKLMLESVVLNGHGKRAAVEGIRVGGKTGTAQVANPQGGYYENQHVGTFAGMFPIEDPQFVMVVRLDNPKTVRFAESSAAPTFGAIARWITNYYQLR